MRRHAILSFLEKWGRILIVFIHPSTKVLGTKSTFPSAEITSAVYYTQQRTSTPAKLSPLKVQPQEVNSCKQLQVEEETQNKGCLIVFRTNTSHPKM